MSDTYQAVYDAARSRIGFCDVGGAIESAMREAQFGHYAEMAMRAVQDAVRGYESPSAIYRPAISIDGNQWCALYGDNLQDGVAGFGDSPALAMADFDRAWYAKLATPATPAQGQTK